MRNPIALFNTRTAARFAQPPLLRSFTTAGHQLSSVKPQSPAPETGVVHPRWLSELQSRMKQCLALNLAPKKAQELGKRLDYLERNWLALSAGREGFLADADRKGLYKHAVAWGDMGKGYHGHVNNVIYNRYAESGRVNWARNFAKVTDPKYKQIWLDLMIPRGMGLILASIKTDYKFPMTYPDQVTVLHKLVTRPDYDSDRFQLEAVIYSERQKRPAARCFEDIVVYDYDAAKKAPLKPFMVDALRAAYDLQLERKQEAERQVAELHEFVKRAGEDVRAA